MSIFGAKTTIKNVFGTFTGHILDWYDGPMLIKCQNERNESFICILQERETGYEQWVFVPMSETRLNDILSGKISLRHMITKVESEIVYLVDCHYDNEENSKVTSIHPNELTDDDLPDEDSYYDCSDMTFEE